MMERAAAAAVLRPADEDDDSALQRIYAHHVLIGLASFEEIPPNVGEMERRRRAVQEHGLPYLVAESAGRVLGFAYAAHYRPRSGYRFTVEDSVYMEPAAMGEGIGRKLLTAVIAAAEKAGMRQMIAVIGDSANLPSIRLHERLGFKHAGVFQAVGWKHNRWLDSVLMQRALGPGAETVPDQPTASSGRAI